MSWSSVVAILALSGGVALAQGGSPPQQLNGVGASATREGLSGVVLDSAGLAARGVIIRAVPLGGEHPLPASQRTNHETRTDSSGAFFLPLVSGSYDLRVEHDGAVRISVQVFVPKRGSRCVALEFRSPDKTTRQGRACGSANAGGAARAPLAG